MDGDVEFVRQLFHASYRRLVGQLTAVNVARSRFRRRLSRGRAALTELVSEHVDDAHDEGVNRG